jgi:alkylation response protein AidB-like acyl-CoA dehydrogenase
MAVRASSLAVQLLGAAGYMEDHPTEQWYRDAKWQLSDRQSESVRDSSRRLITVQSPTLRARCAVLHG